MRLLLGHEGKAVGVMDARVLGPPRSDTGALEARLISTKEIDYEETYTLHHVAEDGTPGDLYADLVYASSTTGVAMDSNGACIYETITFLARLTPPKEKE